MFLFVGVTLTASGNSLSKDSVTYRFGVVPQFDQRRIVAVWQPILKELSARTGYTFHLEGSSNITEFETKLMAGRFDCAYMNPYHMVKAHKAQGYIPLVRDHARMLRGVIVAAANGPIDSLQDLQGRTVVFPAPNAVGASLLVRAALADAGINTTNKYVRTHSSVYLHVARGLADAGGGVLTTLQAQPAAVRKRLRVVYRTAELAPHPVACHPRIARSQRGAIQQAFIQIGHFAKLHELYEQIPMRQPGAARYSDYAPLDEMGLKRLDGLR
jgi:phosphonate transport system substrate-binding protein